MTSDIISTQATNKTDDGVKHQRTMAFEMETGGHHASYIRNFAQQWAENLAPHEIHFVVTPEFFQRHQDVIELIESLATDAVQIHEISATENEGLGKGAKRIFNGWKLFCKYADSLKVDRGLLMYSDHFQIPMLIGQASPCPVSCIYFRPTFHYGSLENYQPSFKQRIAAWRKHLMVKRLLKLKQMDVLFSLDPLAVGYMKDNFSTHAKIRQLPDSFVRYKTTASQIDELRSELAVEQGRKICMLLGVLDSRKGPLQLLDAASQLPEAVQNKLCLLLVGSLTPAIENEVVQKVELLQQTTPLQVILKNDYISDTIVQRYYELADVALTTYQRHMGMSSALIRAALAEIPVLSSSYGLMGNLVEKERLGVTVDTEDPVAFTKALATVAEQPTERLFDVSNALAFASSHSPVALAETLKQWAI